jgi:hypothetical protein
MREARIILPYSPDGDSFGEHYRLRKLLAQNFGGYTATFSYGGWVNGDGHLVEENVYVYDVAMPANDLNVDRLTILAHESAIALEQDSVYIRYPDGLVVIDKAGQPSRKLAATVAFPRAVRDMTPAELAGTVVAPPHEEADLQAQRALSIG